jgi:hypothetical protein
VSGFELKQNSPEAKLEEQFPALVAPGRGAEALQELLLVLMGWHK